jgi:putative serine protease PepD
MLREVVAGGPAATAGLASGDVITRIDDVEISSMSSLVIALRSHQPGDTVMITYRPGGTESTVSVALTEKP